MNVKLTAELLPSGALFAVVVVLLIGLYKFASSGAKTLGKTRIFTSVDDNTAQAILKFDRLSVYIVGLYYMFAGRFL